MLKRDSTRFWRKLKLSKKSVSHSKMNVEDFMKHFSGIMQDTGHNLTDEKISVTKHVEENFVQLRDLVITHIITPEEVKKCILKLKRNSSPGIDGITGEFLINGASNILFGHLASLYSTILSYNCVPTIFNTGVMIPILKKPTLSPSIPGNYRPIIVSSLFSKVFELLIFPCNVQLNDNQFGFRPGFGVHNGINLLNDLMCYSKSTKSNMFLCSLDAEKCFDSIWHDSLFYKLYNVLPSIHWRFLRKWYTVLDVVIKWNGTIQYNSYFKVTRGTRQGSILSPVLFNVFLSDLMEELSNCDTGIRVGNYLLNSFAYADDVSLFSSIVPGLQILIDRCADYAALWRFNFGIKKTNCMSVGKDCFSSQPSWYLNGVQINTVSNIDILGVNFCSSARYDEHIKSRVHKCKRSMYSLSNVGMCYPGLKTESKVHLYKTTCLPTLMYGLDCISLTKRNIHDIQSAQGSVMKNVCGLSKRSHHSAFLQALNITNASDYLNDHVKSLFVRICSNNSITRDICMYFINLFVTQNIVFPGTLVNRIIDMGISPTSLLLSSHKKSSHEKTSNGLIDSLSAMLYNDNYVKPWSNEYLLVKLLTKSF